MRSRILPDHSCAVMRCAGPARPVQAPSIGPACDTMPQCATVTIYQRCRITIIGHEDTDTDTRRCLTQIAREIWQVRVCPMGLPPASASAPPGGMPGEPLPGCPVGKIARGSWAGSLAASGEEVNAQAGDEGSRLPNYPQAHQFDATDRDVCVDVHWCLSTGAGGGGKGLPKAGR